MDKYELKIGNNRLVLDKHLLTITNIRKLNRELAIAHEDWLKDINDKLDKIKEIGEQHKDTLDKGDKESPEEYQERIKPIQDDVNNKLKEIVGEDGIDSLIPLAFKTLQIMASLDRQESKVTMENLENSVWQDVREFISSFLGVGRVDFGKVFADQVDLSTATVEQLETELKSRAKQLAKV